MTNLTTWRWTGLFGKGHTTYAPGRLVKEGPFSNPARMIEDIMGHDPAPMAPGARSESQFMADVWMHAGWWDPK